MRRSCEYLFVTPADQELLVELLEQAFHAEQDPVRKLRLQELGRKL